MTDEKMRVSDGFSDEKPAYEDESDSQRGLRDLASTRNEQISLGSGLSTIGTIGGPDGQERFAEGS